jgi:hypothetical protein
VNCAKWIRYVCLHLRRYVLVVSLERSKRLKWNLELGIKTEIIVLWTHKLYRRLVWYLSRVITQKATVYTTVWPFPAQSFSAPSPLGLATIFYCLRFETSLFVVSYDSQGHGGGIRQSQSQSHIATDCQSASQSVTMPWCRAPSGAHDQMFIIVWQLRSCFYGAPSLTRGWDCLLTESLSAVVSHLS